jgi:hypothetical protein
MSKTGDFSILFLLLLAFYDKLFIVPTFKIIILQLNCIVFSLAAAMQSVGGWWVVVMGSTHHPQKAAHLRSGPQVANNNIPI